MDSSVNLSQPKPINPAKRNGSALVVIILAVLVIVGIAGVALVVMGKSSVKTTPAPATTQNASDAASLEEELNTLAIEEVEADFAGVEQDLKGL